VYRFNWAVLPCFFFHASSSELGENPNQNQNHAVVKASRVCVCVRVWGKVCVGAVWGVCVAEGGYMSGEKRRHVFLGVSMWAQSQNNGSGPWHAGMFELGRWVGRGAGVGAGGGGR